MKLFKYLFAFMAVVVVAVQGTAYTCPEMQELIAKNMAGVPQQIQNELLCISYYESSWNPSTQNEDGSIGLWQILPNYCGDVCKQCKSGEDLYNADINTQCALEIYNLVGLNAWEAYTDGFCKSWNKCSGITPKISGTGVTSASGSSGASASSGTSLTSGASTRTTTYSPIGGSGASGDGVSGAVSAGGESVGTSGGAYSSGGRGGGIHGGRYTPEVKTTFQPIGTSGSGDGVSGAVSAGGESVGTSGGAYSSGGRGGGIHGGRYTPSSQK